MKTVAIITRTKDREFLLERAIQSVLAQSFTDWVHVIVNDGGDKAKVNQTLSKYEKQYGDKLLQIHRSESSGMEAASNAAIKASQSKYIVIHDDDDSWNPDFLRTGVEQLSSIEAITTYQAIATRSMQINEKIDDQGNVEQESIFEFNPNLEVITIAAVAGRNPIPPISFLYSRAAYEQVGGYDETLKVAGDWDFNLRFLQKFDIKVIPIALANYHIRSNATGAYQNTVVAGVDKHTEARSLIENKFLREELASGKIGLGQLISQQKVFAGFNDKLEALEKLSNKRSNIIQKLKNLILGR